MLNKVAEAIKRFDLLKGVERIAVALSGGADSMALLCALLELKDELNIKEVSAAHFNHKIRGEEALRDQNFVAEQCEKLGVKLYLGCEDVPKFAQKNGVSLELAARMLRYEFFETLDADVIATAHTASDNVETVIFNLTRGAGLSGLCGIPYKRERYIRPLVLCTRDDVENYCAQNKIDFVTDSTNLCDDYTRNKIRHNVVPVLKGINESVENAVNRMTASLREDENFIDGIAQSDFECRSLCDGLSLSGFDELHPAIAKRVIAKYCANLNIDADNFHINGIYGICISGGKISLPRDKSAFVENEKLKITDNKISPQAVNFSVDIKRQKNDLFENCEKVHNLLLKNILACDKIMGQLVLRGRMSGDKIRLKNKNCTKTLKKLFCEYKIPQAERESWPLLADDNGVVWIHKIGVAERAAADETSEYVYKINVEKL